MPEYFEKRRPDSGESFVWVQKTPPDRVGDAVGRARQAQRNWGATSVDERGQAIVKIGQLIADRADALAELISAETGKPKLEALTQEILGTAHLAHYFGRRAARILERRHIRSRLFIWRQSYIHYAPRGVVAVIGPWNFPFALTAGDALMALCAGNAVVLKPSEHTPLCAFELQRLVTDAGLDAELLQVVQGHGDVGDALVHAGVDMVHFTGSVATGRRIAAACGAQLIPCVAELGGKDAAVVLEDADLEHTAQVLAYGGFANAGQVCASVERVYAVGRSFAPLVERITAIAKSLKQHSGVAQADIGPMVTAAQLQVVEQQVADACDQGATVHTGGQRQGAFYRPTVLTGVRDEMTICREETFGPVLPIMQVDSIDEAIRRANDSVYGLSAYVFTRNIQRGRQIAEALVAGTVLINEVLVTHAAAETPWGGVKHSGLGHTHADSGLRHLCQMRHVNYSRLPMINNPWSYPYGTPLQRAFSELIKGYFGSGSWSTRLRRLMRGGLRLVRHRSRR